MSFDLYVDEDRWRAHLGSVLDSMPPNTSLVPVVKGNGYGFAVPRLAEEAARLGVPAVAVGTYAELPAVERSFPGDLLVLEPWRPGVRHGLDDRRVIHTVSREKDLAAVAGTGARVVLEQVTSLRRFGFEVGAAARRPPVGVSVEGVALHLPLVGDASGQAQRLGDTVHGAGDFAGPLWVSHLTPAAAGELARRSGLDVRLRLGTALWLGERAALRPRATVLEVRRLGRGDPSGYRQRKAPGAGSLIVVSGGTAHGVALEAPRPVSSLRERAATIALGGLEALGRNPSPYRWQGKRLWFAEPPHMQVSLLWLPGSAAAPGVGAELDVDVRYTISTFDAVRRTSG